MTFYSLRIELFDANVTDDELESASVKSRALANLDYVARTRCAPHELADWAKSRSLAVHFVDNEWVRVVVTDDALKQFAVDILKEPGALDSIVARRPSNAGQIVLSAEEF